MRGQSMVEFVIIIPVLLMLVFGIVQMGLLYSAKTSLNYASFEAARSGALNNATYEGMRKGLIRGLAPLFAREADAKGFNRALQETEAEVDKYVRIIRLNPVQSDFSPSNHGAVQDVNGQPVRVIPNDNLMYRAAISKGGVNIQDANLLKIRVEYCYKLVVPVISSLLSVFNPDKPELSKEVLVDSSESVNPDYESLCGDRSDSKRGFIISSEAIVRMQSPAYESCDGRMICPSHR